MAKATKKILLGNSVAAPTPTLGTQLDDTLLGGDGNDLIIGLKGDDVIDGGGGSDRVMALGGDDRVSYTWLDHLSATPDFASLGTRDVYDGGQGFDTLVLKLTYGEYALASFQQDIAGLQAFVGAGSQGHFQFSTFDLRVSNFEMLEIEFLNTDPVAHADSGAIDEDSVLVAAARGVLANDSDGDHLDVIHISGFDATSALGAAVLVNADGSYAYDPRGSAYLQGLGAGETETDTFTYTIEDLGDASATATVSIQVTGVNDPPEAGDDVVAQSAADDGAISVAVVFESLSDAVTATVQQLNDDSFFDFNATAVRYSAVASAEDLAGYDVVLLGNSYFEALSPEFWAALRGYVESGDGGVVANGWTNFNLSVVESRFGPLARADYEAAVPVGGDDFTSASGALVALSGHEITEGLTELQAFGEVVASAAIDAEAVSLATLFGADSVLAYVDLAGQGRSVYLGFHYTDAEFRDAGMAGSAGGDRLLEQAVDWARGQSGGDVTEDSKATIASDALLANDTDVDRSDVLSIDSVSATSARHAAVSLDDDGNVLYDASSSAELDALGAGETRPDTFSYRVTDGHGGFDTATATVIVHGRNDAPLAHADAASTDEDHAATIDVLANDTDVDATDTRTVDTAVIAAGLGQASIAEGRLVYDPGASYQSLAQGESATVEIEYTMSDDHGATAAAGVSVLVAGLNDPPVAVPDAAATDEDTSVAVDVLANDTDVDASDTHTLDSAVLASGLGSVSMAGGVVTYDPGSHYQHLAEGEGDEVVIDYVMSDNHLAAAASTLTIGVFGRNDGPDAVDDGIGGGAAATDEDTGLTLDPALLLANDTDPDTSDVLSVVAVAAESALGAAVSIEEDGTVRYDPGSVFQHLAAGATANDSFTYTVDDGHDGQDTASVNLTIAGANDAPHASDDDAYQLGADGSLSVEAALGLLANDTDPDDGAILSVQLVDGPASGTLVLNADGSFSYVAGEQFTGTDTFTYRASDGAAQSNLATVTVSGAAVNRAPVAANNSYSLNEDTTLTVSAANGVLANDTDADGNALSAVTVTGPAHGALVLSADGSFSYTPTANFFGTDTFTYKANDGLADSKAATVTLTVNNVAEPGGGGGSNKLADDVLSDTPLRYVMRVAGMTKDWVELDSFSLGLSNGGGPIGPDIGRSEHENLVVTLGSSSTVVKLTQLLGTGAHLQDVQIQAFTIGGEPRLVDSYKFTEVTVNGLDTAAASGQTSYAVSFDYGAFGHSHFTGDPKGGAGAETRAGFNVDARARTSEGGGSGQWDDIKLDEQIDSSTDLSYYARFDATGVAPEWVRLESLSFDMARPQSFLGGGGGSGVLSTSDAQLTLGASKQFAQLLPLAGTGQHLKEVEIEAYRGTDKLQLVDEFRFTDVSVALVHSDNATDNALALHFDRFTHGHVIVDPKGGVTSTVSEGYDFGAREAIDGPAPAANASATKTFVDVPPGTALRYVMRAPGVTKDWVELDSFSTGLSHTTGSHGETGRAQGEDLVVTLGSSSAVVELVELLGTGAHLTEVQVQAYTIGGAPRLVDSYKFTEVTVTGFDTDAASEETSYGVSFGYTKVGHSHFTGDPKGGAGTETRGGFNLATGQKTADGGGTGSWSGIKLDPQVDSSTDLSYFVRFTATGVAPEWVRLESLDFDVTRPHDVFGGGSTSGLPKASDAQLTLGASKQFTQLLPKAGTGQHLQEVEVEAYRTGGDKGLQLVDEFRFKDVTIAVAHSDNAADNTLALRFDSFTHGHVVVDPKGGVTSSASEGYDFEDRKAIDGPAPAADASATKAFVDVLSDTPLRYVMRVSGMTKDWVELDSFSLGLSNDGGPIGPDIGRSEHEDVVVTLGSSSTVVKLTQLLGTGAHLQDVQIQAFTTGATPRLVDSYKFTEVTVNGLDTAAASAETSYAVSLDYRAFGHSHFSGDPKGGAGAETRAGFNVDASSGTSDGGGSGNWSSIRFDEQIDSSTDLSYYVRFDATGVAPEWVRLESLSFDMTRPQSLGGSGGSSGVLSTSDAQLTLGASKQFTQLLPLGGTGQHLKEVEIEAYRGLERPVLVDEFHFKDVAVSLVHSDNATDNTLALRFDSFTHGHVMVDPKGGAGSSVSEGYDFGAREAIDGPAPHADIDFF